MMKNYLMSLSFILTLTLLGLLSLSTLSFAAEEHKVTSGHMMNTSENSVPDQSKSELSKGKEKSRVKTSRTDKKDSAPTAAVLGSMKVESISKGDSTDNDPQQTMTHEAGDGDYFKLRINSSQEIIEYRAGVTANFVHKCFVNKKEEYLTCIMGLRQNKSAVSKEELKGKGKINSFVEQNLFSFTLKNYNQKIWSYQISSGAKFGGADFVEYSDQSQSLVYTNLNSNATKPCGFNISYVNGVFRGSFECNNLVNDRDSTKHIYLSGSFSLTEASQLR